MSLRIKHHHNHIIDVNAATLQEEIRHTKTAAYPQLALVCFWEPNSLPCLRIMGFVEQAADLCKDYLRVLRVNVAQEQTLGYANNIHRIPAFAIYQYNEQVDKIVTTDPIHLEEVIIKHISGTYPVSSSSRSG